MWTARLGLFPFQGLNISEWQSNMTPNRRAIFILHFTDERLVQHRKSVLFHHAVVPAIWNRDFGHALPKQVAVYLFIYSSNLVDLSSLSMLIYHDSSIKHHASYRFVKIDNVLCKVCTLCCTFNVLCVLHISLLDIFLQLPTLRCNGFRCDLASPTTLVQHPSRSGHELLARKSPKKVGFYRCMYICNYTY